MTDERDRPDGAGEPLDPERRDDQRDDADGWFVEQFAADPADGDRLPSGEPTDDDADAPAGSVPPPRSASSGFTWGLRPTVRTDIDDTDDGEDESPADAVLQDPDGADDAEPVASPRPADLPSRPRVPEAPVPARRAPAPAADRAALSDTESARREPEPPPTPTEGSSPVQDPALPRPASDAPAPSEPPSVPNPATAHAAAVVPSMEEVLDAPSPRRAAREAAARAAAAGVPFAPEPIAPKPIAPEPTAPKPTAPESTAPEPTAPAGAVDGPGADGTSRDTEVPPAEEAASSQEVQPAGAVSDRPSASTATSGSDASARPRGGRGDAPTPDDASGTAPRTEAGLLEQGVRSGAPAFGGPPLAPSVAADSDTGADGGARTRAAGDGRRTQRILFWVLAVAVAIGLIVVAVVLIGRQSAGAAVLRGAEHATAQASSVSYGSVSTSSNTPLSTSSGRNG